MRYVDNPFESPAVLSICPGILGLERGLERALGPIRTIAYVEIEAFAVENLLAGMEAGILAPAPIWTNLKTFDARPFRGKICGIVGGYPCQPFSTAGKQAGVEDPRHLWPFIAGVMRTTRPVWGFFENVAAHANEGFDQVYRDLHEMGYRVEAGIFAAEEVGAPHQRERLFILAILADASCFGEQPRGRECQKNRRSGQFMDGSKQRGNSVNCSEGELANANSYGSGAESGGIGQESGPDEREIQRQEWNALQRQRGGGFAGDNGSEMANGLSQRLEEWGEQSSRAKQSTVERGGPSDRWPARPGEHPHDWEAPRTVESGLGCTIDGYNFREDLLRALGNSVVEQQAEYAFRVLMMKHLK